jgi:hypothetical protein
MADKGFLARWSRRKSHAGAAPVSGPHPSPLPAKELGEEAPEVVTASAALAQPRDAETSHYPVGRGIEAKEHASAPTDLPPPPPTLEDVAKLTPSSDFRRFIAPTVDPAIKNAALKKLFADPHFNVMDGLDVYIDDYGKPSPIPAATLRQLAQARGLGLFDDEPAPNEPQAAKASPDGAASAGVPESSQESTAVPPDEDPDLRLQQDDAAGCGGAEERPPT